MSKKILLAADQDPRNPSYHFKLLQNENVESTNITNNSWQWSYHSITDYISLNDEVQFRFIVSDEYFVTLDELSEPALQPSMESKSAFPIEPSEKSAFTTKKSALF